MCYVKFGSSPGFEAAMQSLQLEYRTLSVRALEASLHETVSFVLNLASVRHSRQWPSRLHRPDVFLDFTSFRSHVAAPLQITLHCMLEPGVVRFAYS